MSNPLTQDQLRRVDYWIAENLFGYVRALYTYCGGEQVWIVAPSEMQAIPCLEPTTKPITRFNDPYLPKYTDSGSPRRLLEEAVAKTVEKVGRLYKMALRYLLDGPARRISFDKFVQLNRGNISDNWSLPIDTVIQIDTITTCQAIVLALGGNWSEVINGN